MLLQLLVSAVLIAAGNANNYECPPSGKKITIPDTTFLFPDDPFYFEIDNSQYDGDPYVEEVIEDVQQIQDIVSFSAAIYIGRKNPLYKFRMIYFDFTVSNVDTMTIRFYRNNYELKEETIVFPPYNPLSLRREVRLHSVGNEKPGSEVLNFPYLENGLLVSQILITYTRRDVNSYIQFGEVFLAACTWSAYGGGPSDILVNPFSPGSFTPGVRIPDLVGAVVSWVNDYASKYTNLATKLLTRSVRSIKQTSKVFKKRDPEYIYADMPTENDDYVRITAWLQENNVQVQKVVQQIRNLLLPLDDAAIKCDMSKSSRKVFEKLMKNLLKGLADVDKEIVATGNEYLARIPVSTDFDRIQNWCESTNDCKRAFHICCYCKCRRTKECQIIQAQESLRQCIGMKLDRAVANTKQPYSNVFGPLCDAADLVGGKWKEEIEYVKLRVKLLTGPLPIPHLGEQIPGKPELSTLTDFTKWQRKTNSNIQQSLDDSRSALRNIGKLLMKKRRDGVDRDDIVYVKMAALLKSYDIVDEAVTNTTVCYMQYLLEAYPRPLID